MKVVRDGQQRVEQSGPHVVTIGTYDGVHLGHQSVISLAQRKAAELGVACAVVTFDPHPASVVRPESAPLLLTDLEQKLELLAALDVDTTVLVTFDEARAQETAEQFIQSILVDTLAAKVVIVGHDFHFGKGRGGDVDLLAAVGAELGFDVIGLDLLGRPDDDSQAVSSTLIRRTLAEGDVSTAAKLLGRPHEVRGPVVGGDERGRTIGFPTANVAVARERALPADGVYAAWYLRPDGTRHRAAVNIGKRPTFYREAEHSLVEAHLLDFSDDLYGELAKVQFVARVRSEQRFDGLDALTAQLRDDIDQVDAILGGQA